MSHESRLEDILESEDQGLDTYIKKQRKAIHELVCLVKGFVSIDRHILGGSIGKGTALGPDYKPDFDVYLFFNNSDTDDSSNQELRSFIHLRMNQVYNFLRSNTGDRYKVIYRTLFAIGVNIRQGDQTAVKVDLIPAINFGKGSVQYTEVLEHIGDAECNLGWINPSYAETSVQFMREQDSFVLDVVRLAKYWNKKCVKKVGFMSGRSVIVETVALKAAQEQMNDWHRKRSLKGALSKFWNYMQEDWDDLRIIVNNDSISDDWPSEAIDEYNDRIYERGVLLDPANPYRNFLDDEHVQNKWGRFQDAAEDSLNDLYCGDVEEAVGFEAQQ